MGFRRILICLIFFFLAGCTQSDRIHLFREANENAVEQLVESFDRASRGNYKIGIAKLSGDEEDKVRDLLMVRLTRLENVQIVSGKEEMDRLLATHANLLQYRDFYESSSLKRLGHLIAPNSILVGKIEILNVSNRKAEVLLTLKLLDLKKGIIAWTDQAKGGGRYRLEKRDYLWRGCILFGVFLCFFLFYKSRETVLYDSRAVAFWFFGLIVCGLVFWLLIGRYLLM